MGEFSLFEKALKSAVRGFISAASAVTGDAHACAGGSGSAKGASGVSGLKGSGGAFFIGLFRLSAVLNFQPYLTAVFLTVLGTSPRSMVVTSPGLPPLKLMCRTLRNRDDDVVAALQAPDASSIRPPF